MRSISILCLAAAATACSSAPVDSGSEKVITVTANEKQAYDFFVEQGLTNFQAAGIVGNLMQESGVNPDSVQSGGPGRGIAQWSAGGRWDTDANDNVLWFAAANGQSALSLQLQLDFIWYELTHVGYGFATLRASTSVTAATIDFQNDFEGCGTCDQSTRITYAEEILAALGSTTPGAGTPTPIVGIARTPDSKGYWLVASDGGIFCFGDAAFHGSLGGVKLAKPIVGMAPTHDGKGYWLVGADGGIFSFGDAVFHGSMGGTTLAKPIVGMAATPDGGGYWLVGSDGGIFTFGDAGYHGSLGGKVLAAPVVAIAPGKDSAGYYMVASDGGVFAFGDAPFEGSAANLQHTPVTSVTFDGSSGYWLLANDGAIYSFGNAVYHGGAN